MHLSLLTLLAQLRSYQGAALLPPVLRVFRWVLRVLSAQLASPTPSNRRACTQTPPRLGTPRPAFYHPHSGRELPRIPGSTHFLSAFEATLYEMPCKLDDFSGISDPRVRFCQSPKRELADRAQESLSRRSKCPSEEQGPGSFFLSGQLERFTFIFRV